jgi:hypothetical protein
LFRLQACSWSESALAWLATPVRRVNMGISANSRRFSGLLAFCQIVLWAGFAFAGSGRVAVVAKASDKSALAAALLRIQGELVAEGFEVVIEKPTAPETGEGLAAVAERADALAAIGLSYDADTREVELTVVDRLTHKTLVRRAPLGVDEGSDAEVLAVRAVDLLRASLLELLAPPRAALPPPAPALRKQQQQARTFARRALPSEPRHETSVELGAGLLMNPSGIGPAILPLARVERRLSERLALRLDLAGLGSKPLIEDSHASARVSQEFAELCLLVGLWSTRTLRLDAALAAGALHTSAEGKADLPYRAQKSSLWSAIFDAGLGLDVALSSRLGLRFESHALIAEPYPVVRFGQQEYAHGGVPSLFETATLRGWL